MDTTTLNPVDYSKQSLSQLAFLIRTNWKKQSKNGIYFGAVPYLEAMGCLNSVDDKYILDSGASIVRYFLANAATWKGEVAKAIKKELNARIKGKY